MNQLYQVVYKPFGTFLGIGFLKFAPGTIASGLTALLLFYIPIPWGLDFFLIILFLLLGIKSASKLELEYGKDADCIVIDEVVGMWISVLFIPREPICFLFAFVLFRIFDISKILFIKNMEQFNSGLGVMMDDVLAGIYTNLLIQVIILYLLIK